MNFLFVDRILALEPGKRTLALKHVTPSDSYLTLNQENQTTLVSCIIGEALGQLCSWNVIRASDFRLRLIGGIVGEVRMFDEVYLGETITLENKIDRLDLENQVVNFHGIAKVGERKIVEVNDGLGPLLPVEDFGDVSKVKAEFSSLYRPGEIPSAPEGQPISDVAIEDSRPHFLFDRIVSWEKGKQVVAQKNLTLLAPYFADHFPKRPVLPLSLLMECQLQLAYPFITELVGNKKEHHIQPICIRRIKMNDFIEPGSMVFVTMKLKEYENDRVVLTFRTEVDGRRVCVAEAEFMVRN